LLSLAGSLEQPLVSAEPTNRQATRARSSTDERVAGPVQHGKGKPAHNSARSSSGATASSEDSNAAVQVNTRGVHQQRRTSAARRSRAARLTRSRSFAGTQPRKCPQGSLIDHADARPTRSDQAAPRQRAQRSGNDLARSAQVGGDANLSHAQRAVGVHPANQVACHALLELGRACFFQGLHQLDDAASCVSKKNFMACILGLRGGPLRRGKPKLRPADAKFWNPGHSGRRSSSLPRARSLLPIRECSGRICV